MVPQSTQAWYHKARKHGTKKHTGMVPQSTQAWCQKARRHGTTKHAGMVPQCTQAWYHKARRQRSAQRHGGVRAHQMRVGRMKRASSAIRQGRYWQCGRRAENANRGCEGKEGKGRARMAWRGEREGMGSDEGAMVVAKGQMDWLEGGAEKGS